VYLLVDLYEQIYIYIQDYLDYISAYINFEIFLKG